MPSKYALSVSLTEHLRTFIDDQIASGRFGTASEVIRAALRLLEQETGRQGVPAVDGQAQPPAVRDDSKDRVGRPGRSGSSTGRRTP